MCTFLYIGLYRSVDNSFTLFIILTSLVDLVNIKGLIIT